MRLLATARSSNLQLTLLLLGVWWLPQGPAALVMDPGFGTHPVAGSTTHVWFIPLTVNGWHALLHGVTAVAVLLAVRRFDSALRCAVVVGAAYVTIGMWGLLDDTPPLLLVATDTFGSTVHLAEGLIALTAAAAAGQRAGRTQNPGSRVGEPRMR